MWKLNSHSIKATISLTVTMGTLVFTRSRRCALVHGPCHSFCHARLYVLSYWTRKGKSWGDTRLAVALLLDFVASRTLRNTFLFLISCPDCGILFLEQKLSQLSQHVYSLSWDVLRLSPNLSSICKYGRCCINSVFLPIPSRRLCLSYGTGCSTRLMGVLLFVLFPSVS